MEGASAYRGHPYACLDGGSFSRAAGRMRPRFLRCAVRRPAARAERRGLSAGLPCCRRLPGAPCRRQAGGAGQEAEPEPGGGCYGVQQPSGVVQVAGGPAHGEHQVRGCVAGARAASSRRPPGAVGRRALPGSRSAPFFCAGFRGGGQWGAPGVWARRRLLQAGRPSLHGSFTPCAGIEGRPRRRWGGACQGCRNVPRGKHQAVVAAFERPGEQGVLVGPWGP